MTNNFELLQLITPENEALIERYIDTEPSKVAFATRNPLLATAIKYLGRAKTKLPSWYKARCVIDSQLFEQCSSEVAAKSKFENYGGKSALDLTCGLGVDSSVLATVFESVTTVEIDAAKAEIAKYNFSKLSLNNIQVFNDSAENFCENALLENLKFDSIYIDPSRVVKDGENGTKKVYSLEDSSPNIIELLPKLKQLSNVILIKLSPLFDVEECFRIFGKDTIVEVVSTDNECKEVLVKIDQRITNHSFNKLKTIVHTIIKGSLISRYMVDYEPNKSINENSDFDAPKYIYVPDIAFYKSRCVEQYITHYTDLKEFVFDNYIFSLDKIVKSFEGQCFSVELTMPYNTKAIKEELKKRGVKRATIHIRNFAYKLQDIQKSLKISSGNDAHLFFTTYRGKPTFFLVSLS